MTALHTARPAPKIGLPGTAAGRGNRIGGPRQIEMIAGVARAEEDGGPRLRNRR
jgi:hypothetical protein